MRKLLSWIGLTGGLAIAMANPAPAEAHAYAESSVPAQDEVLKAPPGEIRVSFTQEIDPERSALTVTDAEGNAVKAEIASAVDAAELALKLPALDDGVYYVHWRAKSLDTHITEGSYRFAVGVPLPEDSAPASGALAGPAPAAAPDLAPPPGASGGSEDDGSPAVSPAINPDAAGFAKPPVAESDGGSAGGASGGTPDKREDDGGKPEESRPAGSSPGTGNASQRATDKPASRADTAVPQPETEQPAGANASPPPAVQPPEGEAAPGPGVGVAGLPEPPSAPGQAVPEQAPPAGPAGESGGSVVLLVTGAAIAVGAATAFAVSRRRKGRNGHELNQ